MANLRDSPLVWQQQDLSPWASAGIKGRLSFTNTQKSPDEHTDRITHLHPFVVIVYYCGNLSLLQHDLWHPHWTKKTKNVTEGVCSTFGILGRHQQKNQTDVLTSIGPDVGVWDGGSLQEQEAQVSKGFAFFRKLLSTLWHIMHYVVKQNLSKKK